MNLQKALKLLREKMDSYGLESWGAELDRAKCRLGCCHQTSKKISLSKSFIELNDEKEIFDTILHEIAHALVGVRNGHNIVWKLKAEQIGCNGKRQAGKEVAIEKGSIKYVCMNCGKEILVYRTRKRATACGDCCRKYNGGRWGEKYLYIKK